ncbi:MAG: type II toxin-antitoxin system RelE/ParE family toxin [Calditrichaeota bacterium]|nr:type II toxin-antitoxin system RelE/ParE family toxin [Calditrichota bacterium]
MKVSYRKKFLKELAKIPYKTRLQIEYFVFKELPSFDSITESGRIEKLHGYTSFYKCRFGNYRVGIKVENDVVIFERVLHRKEIYRFFP